MSRLIDADVLNYRLSTLDRFCRTDKMTSLLGRVLFIVSKMPTLSGGDTRPIANGDDSYICDACGETVGYDEMECYGISQVRYKFCPECGRKVKWDDSDRNENG